MAPRTITEQTKEGTAAREWPSWTDISEPQMACLYVGNGSTSKPFQAYLDGHPQIYMLPTYPLMYLYPHWQQWQEEMASNWTWPAIIDAFCTQHASVLDSRKIAGFNGLTALGENRDQFLIIDETRFRAFLEHLLDKQPISSRTFLLAIHYAYAFCNGEDLTTKKVLVYHIHVPVYVDRYLAPDFPDMQTIAFVRDPRSNISGRYKNSYAAVDDARLNRTDAIVYARRPFYFTCKLLFEGLEAARELDPDTIKVVRAEDLHYRREEVMAAIVSFLGIDLDPCLKSFSFGGLAWWGDKIYDMKPMNTFNTRVVSDAWKKTLSNRDWFVLEGLFYDYLKKYDYQPYKYKLDSALNRFLLLAALCLPSQVEWRVFLNYLSLKTFLAFLRACKDEANGAIPLKDYSFNAYYRHKWTNQGLNLWRERWYVTLVRKTQTRGVFFRSMGAIVYSAVNTLRYLGSIAGMPGMVAKRAYMGIGVFSRRLKGTSVLPEKF